MFCHDCGKKVIGNYCSYCGTKVIGEKEIEANSNWTTERNFDQLIKYPEVRKLISKYAQEATSTISAQEFLSFADLAFKPITGISSAKLADRLLPIFQKSGISTVKSTKVNLNQTIQELIIKVLCSLTKNGYPIDSTEDVHDGFIFVAQIPSDMWTWGGSIVISVEETEDLCILNIAAKIKGQIYDWGKSKKVIQKVLADIEEIELNI